MDAMSCLPPQPPSFLPAAYYTDAAIARALHYSTMPDYSYSYSPAATASSPSSSSSSLLADFPCSASGAANWFASAAPAPAPAPPTTGLTCDSVLVASAAAPSTPVAAAATSNKRRVGLGPVATGRAGKRRPRASKRAPTTYISTDPANFRLMVQHVTGVQAEPTTGDDVNGVLMPASFDASAAAAAMLDYPANYSGAFGDAVLPSGDAATLSQRLQQQQQPQQPCFPTLDSWSVMYESSELL